MSFSKTWPQILAKQKTVTRRIGWWNIGVGEEFQAVQKGQGLKKGEKVVRGPVLRCVKTHLESLSHLVWSSSDSHREMRMEGFPEMSGLEFVDMFCELNHCSPHQTVNRIEFEYVL